MMSLRRRIEAAERRLQSKPAGLLEVEVINGFPTDSGGIEALCGDEVLLPEPGEPDEAFRARARKTTIAVGGRLLVFFGAGIRPPDAGCDRTSL